MRHDNSIKKIKKNYKVQFQINQILNDKIEKKNIQLTKEQVNLANSQNLRPRSWDRDNPIKNESKNNYETQLPINSILKDGDEKKKRRS